MRERKLVRVCDLGFGPNVRKTKRIEAELRALGKGLREKQLAPIWVNSKNVVRIGEGRVLAARLEGLETLEAIVTDELEDEGALTLAQSQENWLRDDLKDADRVGIVLRLKELYPKALAKDIAEKLHVDPSTITRLMSVSTVVPPVREAFEAGAITLSHVYELSKLDGQCQHELLPVALNGATRDFIGREGRKTRKARPKGGDPVSSSSVTIPLPSGIKVIVRGKRMTLAEVVDCLSECIDAAKKGLKEKLSVKSWQAVLKDKSKETARV